MYTSPYGSPSLFVKKKVGSLQMVDDYRALNKLMHKNCYPLPRNDCLFDKVHGTMQWYTHVQPLPAGMMPAVCPKACNHMLKMQQLSDLCVSYRTSRPANITSCTS